MKMLNDILQGLMRAKKSHEDDKNNPHSVTKAQVGLSNVNNTSDLNKPISKATQIALDKKAEIKEYDSGGWHIREYANGWIEQELYYETQGSELSPISFSGGFYYIADFQIPVEMASDKCRAYSNFFNFGVAFGSSVRMTSSKSIQVIGHSVSLREDKTIITVNVSGYKKV